jgi:hypothetical protein
MPFSLQCPGCGRRLKAPDALASRRLPCPNCRAEVQVPDRPVEDEAAALLMGDEPDATPEPTAAPEPERAPDPVPVRRGPVKPPTPISALPPLKSNEPPVWLRHLHWLLVLALVPLAVSLLRKSDDRDILTRLDETLESAPPEARAKFERTLERAGEDGVDLDDLIAALPRGRVAGAALARDSH